MQLVNIHNWKRKLYLFLRDDEGNLKIKEKDDFFPYYYEPDMNGKAVGYDGTPLRRIVVSDPKEINENCSEESYESDIKFTKRYLINKVKTFDKCKYKYCFLDIEVKAPELPNYQTPKHKITCISVYNSFTDSIRTFYIGNKKYKAENWKMREIKMMKDFIAYMQEEQFDLWLAWNIDFDYNYLYARFGTYGQKYFFEKRSRFNNFATAVSPIGRVRGSGVQYGDIFYPAGISIIDYLQWFKRIEKGEKSYALAYIGEKYLGVAPDKDNEFDKISKAIKYKNIHDVEKMVALEKMKQIIPYYDELRRFGMVLWEDLLMNSRMIEALLLKEARRRKVRLPKKRADVEKEDYQGAYRDSLYTGAFFNVGKYDLGSAYPLMMVNFCLDPANIVTPEAIQNEGIEIEGTVFNQNPDALLPTVVNRLVNMKNEIKTELKKLDPDSTEGKDLQLKYDAVKAVVNSAYGVMGNRFFRLYDKRVASATTFLVRDLLKYVQKRVEDSGHKILYLDTDSVFIEAEGNLSKELNQYIQDWGKQYGKKEITIEFDYEGSFEKILILTKCHYVGYLRTKKGLKPEIKGVEAKRKDSSKFMAVFQRTLIDKILDKTPKDKVIKWIHSEIERMKTLPIEEVAFPCKIAKKNYKNTPVFVKAMACTQELNPDFKKRLGQLFYYIYVVPHKTDVTVTTEAYCNQDRIAIWHNQNIHKNDILEMLNEEGKKHFENPENKLRVLHKKKSKAHNVLAFDEETQDHIKDIDWKTMSQRNIINKVQVIFEAMGWNMLDLAISKEE